MNKKTSKNEELSAHNLLLRSIIPDGNAVQKKGKLYSEALMLLFKKIGITEEELESLNYHSVRENIKTANEFKEYFAAHPLPVEELTKLLMSRIHIPAFSNPTVRDVPFPTGSLRFSLTDPYRNVSLHLEGAGDGLLESTITEYKSSDQFLWKFFTVDKGDYRITSPVIVIGPCMVIADDGPCNDKQADLNISISMQVDKLVNGQPVDTIGIVSEIIYYQYKSNAALRDSLLIGSVLQPTPLSNNSNSTFLSLDKNEEISVSILLTIYGEVKGGGSIIEANFDKGSGVIYCPYLDVGWIGTN